MKNILTSSKITAKAFVSMVLFVMVFSFAQPASAQFTYDYGGSDYGYYSSPSFTYDYGGSDYGYYSSPSFTYDYGGSDYGYYSSPSFTYDYGGSDYGYYSSPSFTYDYGGSDYGYYSNSAFTYDYGGSDYGYYTYDNPITYTTPDYSTYTYDYNAYDYSYTPYTYSTYDYLYQPYNYDYNVGGYAYTPYVYNTGSYTYTPYVYTPYEYNPPVYSNSRPRCEFTVDDRRVERGDHVTLEWETWNADDVRINQGIGDVNDDGTRRVRVTDDITYTLTARDGNDTVTCRVSIQVEQERDRDDVRCDSFTVSDSRVEDGDYVTLRWRTTDADEVRINQGIGDVADDGERRVRITDDTTFTLTARNGNDTDTCRVSVEVEDDRDNDSLRCRLTISDTNVLVGQDVTLSWNNTGADRAVIRDEKGKRIMDTREDREFDEDRDSMRVRVTDSKEFKLTVYDGNRTRTCEVEADTTVAATTVRFQGGINLGQVPYTGFEAGPVLTFIFYAAVVLWGVVMAYVLMKRKEAHEEVAHAHAEPFAHAAVALETYDGPANLPIMDAPVAHDPLKALEQHAHAQYTLLSSDALAYVASLGTTEAEQMAKLDEVIAKAKAQFPKEGDWMVINKERVLSVLG